jgi:hypothetical protein
MPNGISGIDLFFISQIARIRYICLAILFIPKNGSKSKRIPARPPGRANKSYLEPIGKNMP